MDLIFGFWFLVLSSPSFEVPSSKFKAQKPKTKNQRPSLWVYSIGSAKAQFTEFLYLIHTGL